MSTTDPAPAAAVPAAAKSTEQIFAQRYTTTEKLLLAQAVHKFGAAKWDAISSLLLEHPSIVDRTPGERDELFSVKACEEGYVGLMTDIGINVPAEGGIKPHAKPHLQLAQTHYIARMAELRESISTYENRFKTLMSEVQMIKSGEMDGAIISELRMGLVKKFGKKMLDSWIPEGGDVRRAMEGGEVSQEEWGKKNEEAKGASEIVDKEKNREKEVGKENDGTEEPIQSASDGQPEVAQPEEVSTIPEQVQPDAPVKKTKNGRQPRGTAPSAPPTENEEEMEIDQPEPKVEDQPNEDLVEEQNSKPEKGGRRGKKPAPIPITETNDQEPLLPPSTTPGPSSRPSRKGRTPATTEEPDTSSTPFIELPAATSPHITRRRTSKDNVTPAPPTSRSHSKRVTSTPARTPIPEPEPEPEVEPTASPVGSVSDLSDAPAETKSKGKARSRKPATGKRNSRGTKEIEIEEEDEAEEEDVEVGDAEELGTSKKGGNKRKASAPATGAPSGKKRGKKAVSPVPTIITVQEQESEEEGGEDESKIRGRGSMPAPSSTRRGRPPRESPGLITRTRGSSPAVSRRAPSVSSATSAAGGGDGGKRRGRPARTKAGEEEDVEEVEKPTRASGRKKAEAEVEEIAPTPKTGRSHAKKPRPSELEVDDTSKSKRGSGRISAPKRVLNQNEEDDGDSPSVTSPMSPKKERTPAPRPSLGGGGGRGSSRHSNQSPGTRDRKMTAKMLLGLLDQVSSHKNGSVFMNPVREADAPDYYELIKQPMDLKTIRTKIRDGQISNIDEFERDVHLVFANAMMYNEEGSQIHEMAADMLKDAEMHLAQHRSMQQDLGR